MHDELTIDEDKHLKEGKVKGKILKAMVSKKRDEKQHYNKECQREVNIFLVKFIFVWIFYSLVYVNSEYIYLNFFFLTITLFCRVF